MLQASEHLQALNVEVRQEDHEAAAHLEAVKLKLYDIDVDVVHMRTEEYKQGNRIPEVKMGTPF